LHHAHSFSSLDKHLTAERERLAALHGEDAASEDDLGVGDEEEPEELLNLDPKEWKVCLLSSWMSLVLSFFFYRQKQDHYAVLGLSHLRYTASPAQIKVARTFEFFLISLVFL
jgi:DnaJ family protein C protein 2